ncbi:hypothetical protein OK016_04220 [Vibrio chagasii]|nr:hypothetical protein [Vibrio chagasii]
MTLQKATLHVIISLKSGWSRRQPGIHFNRGRLYRIAHCLTLKDWLWLSDEEAPTVSGAKGVSEARVKTTLQHPSPLAEHRSWRNESYRRR